ncbi:hypothetical protein K0M31_019403 [Melipona bicolor]|uniref:Uncharacterized protein n=1 Tax=Melipona bicolor TaxID=60889 RepID=A0AA40KRC6_9HYME|nr:hypothetical protein K0M31_019403 [Melipona bicolor]
MPRNSGGILLDETDYKRPLANSHDSTVVHCYLLDPLSRPQQVKMFAVKFLVLLAGLIGACSAGLLPAAVPAAAVAAPIPAALTIGTYASSYNAHAINHAVAAPYIASPVIAHAAAAPLAYSSLPAASFAYSGVPAATLIAGRR